MRLKNNINDTSLSLDSLLAIKVRDFSYNSDSDNRVIHGFIAQELYDTYPDAVSKPVNPDEYWKVSYGQLTPLIVKSIQDLDLKVIPLTSLDTTNSNSLGSLIKSFLANSLNNIQNIFTNRVTTKEICVDSDTCLNEQDIRNLINNAHNTQTNTENNNTNNTTDTEDVTTNSDTNPPVSEAGTGVENIENQTGADTTTTDVPETTQIQ